MWGRRPGQSVADEIARRDLELANWKRGEQGELIVGEELSGLTEHEWWVFHSIRRGKSGTDIDHLVIGVGGIYTLNTKNVSGNVWVAERVLMVGGERTSYLPAATSEARDVARRMRSKTQHAIDVRPVLIFTSQPTIKAMPTDVTVLRAGSVRTWLESQPRVMTPHEAYELVLIANEPTTWI